MKLIGDTLYIEFSEAVLAEIPEGTVKSAFNRNSSHWKFIKDPDDLRKTLIDYEALKARYRHLITGHFGNPYQYAAAQIILPLLVLSDGDKKFFDDYILPSGERPGNYRVGQWKRECMYLNMISMAYKSFQKSIGYTRSTEFYNALSMLIEQEKNKGSISLKFPTSYVKLRKKTQDYASKGPGVVINGNYSNTNRQKLTEDLKEAAIAEYAKKTNNLEKVTRIIQDVLKTKGESITRQAIYYYLHKPSIEPLWFFGRHGETEWRKRFEHNMRLFLPTYRDAMWNIDGTKLNLYYNEPKAGDKKASLFQINKVIDVASEVILGYDLLWPGHQEDHQSHYRALKTSVQQAGQRPYQLLYDGQGGHTGAKMQEFYERLNRVHFRAMPYNGQSKSIENLINRFQQQIMKQCWFFTGMNITTNTLESQPNLDYINANRDRLPQKKDIPEIVRLLVNEWNNSEHPKHKGVTRLEYYNQSVNPNPRPVEWWDMVELFWLVNEGKEGKGIVYRKDGIRQELKGEKFIYEVVDDNGYPDMEFRQKYLLDKFIIKYDPEDLTQIILYKKDASGDLRYVAIAKDKEQIPRFVGDYKEGTRVRIDELLKLRKDEKENTRRKLEEITESAKVLSPADDFENWIRQACYGNKAHANTAEAALAGGGSGYTGLYESDTEASDTGKVIDNN